MFKTVSETRGFFHAFLPDVRNVDHCDIVIAPPYTALFAAVEVMEAKIRRGKEA